MYQIGDKFIIEIGGIYSGKRVTDLEGEPQYLYKIKGFNSLVFDDNGLKKLEKHKESNSEIINIGDEVCFDKKPSTKFVVTLIVDKLVHGVSNGGKVYSVNKEYVSKTGKHFDILAF